MYLRANHRRLLVALASAGALVGCSGDFESGWFSKPLNITGNNLGYSYAQLGETKRERHITADDLVDANGACPRFAPPPQAPPVNPDGNAAAALGTAELRGGIGIGLTECEVVSRIGAPTAVNLGRAPNGDRTAVLTYQGGLRPGIYRFVAGKLTEMDRVAEAPPPPQPEKPAKKKPAKTKKPPKADSAGSPATQ